jgi:hypothetical protein
MKPLWLGAAGVALLFASSMGGCSCDGDGSGDAGSGANSGNGAGGEVFVGSGGEGPCVNLECQQVDCDGGGVTTLSATIYDPSGTLPLHGVVVYVPNADVAPLEDGLSCDQCDAELSGDPVVTDVTDTEGKFVLEDVPVVNDLPLVIQVGKWRRQITVPTVEACVDNTLDDPDTFRLPAHKSEGDIPRIALTTGGADPLFCLFRKMGIADEEFGISGSDARLHFFRGVDGGEAAAAAFDNGFGASPGADFPDATNTLWEDGWTNYDIVLLSCEGQENNDSKNGHREALANYLNAGGRAFATHYHYSWLGRGETTSLTPVAEFSSDQNDYNDIVDINQSFPKGEALAAWLEFVDGSHPLGQFLVTDGRRHTMSINDAVARDWVNAPPQGTGDGTMYFSFNAPVGAAEEDQCGRMVYSDIHISAGAGDASGDFPGACNDGPLTEQEKALIFMFFDLSSCVQDDDTPITPPS